MGRLAAKLGELVFRNVPWTLGDGAALPDRANDPVVRTNGRGGFGQESRGESRRLERVLEAMVLAG